MTEDYATAFAWAIDFCRALNQRSRLFKWIAGRMMGRYARRELQGLMEEFEKKGYYPDMAYDLEDAEYHKRLNW